MKYQVLLVDDEQIYLQYLQQMIDWDALDCQICGCANNGEDAIRMVEEKQPDIVFMDINMSQMDGLEACEALREKENQVKIIIMTAFNEFSFAHRAIKLNVADYLLKPFYEEELIKTLQKCKEEIKKEREYKKNRRETFFKELLDSGISKEESEQMERGIFRHHYLAVLFRRKREVTLSERENFRNLLGSYFAPFSMESYFLGNRNGCGIIIQTMLKEQIPLREVKRQYKKLLQEHPEEGVEWVAIGNLDGPDALKHLDRILQIPGLSGVQWVYGAGNPTASHWIPEIKKIQAAGKCVHIEVEPKELEIMLRELSPEGLMYHIVAGSEQEARDLLKMAER